MTKYIVPPEAKRLDDLAATQIIADDAVVHCWELVRHGIQTLKIGTGNLGRLIGHLRAGNGMTLDELTVEVEPTGSDRMLVALLDDERTCSAPKMIDELERLAGRAGTPSPAGPAGGGPRNGTPAGTPPDTSAASGEDPDLLGLLAGLLGTTPGRLAERDQRIRKSARAAIASPDQASAVSHDQIDILDGKQVHIAGASSANGRRGPRGLGSQLADTSVLRSASVGPSTIEPSSVT